MKLTCFSVAALSFLATVSSAHAEDQPYWYGAIHGELTWAEDSDLKVAGRSIGNLNMDLEYAAGIAVGIRPYCASCTFWGNTRYELQATYREIDFNSLDNQTLAPGGFGGSIESYVGMANVYYDFNNESDWTPYAGFGLGYAYHTFDSITINTDDNDTTFAYRGMAGVMYDLGATYSNAQVGLGYRYFGSADPEFNNAAGQSVEMEYESHNLEGTIRVPF